MSNQKQSFDFNAATEQPLIKKLPLQISSETPILLVDFVEAFFTTGVKKDPNFKTGVARPAKDVPVTPEMVTEDSLRHYINFVFESGTLYRSNVSTIVWEPNLQIANNVVRAICFAVTGQEPVVFFNIKSSKEGGYSLTLPGEAEPTLVKTAVQVIEQIVNAIGKMVKVAPITVWLKLKRNDGNGGRPNELVFGLGNFIATGSADCPEFIQPAPNERFDVIEENSARTVTTPAAAAIATTHRNPFAPKQ